MRRLHGNRAKLGGTLLAVAAALAILALPGLATGHGRHHDHGPAGTVESFDPETGVLSVALAKGGTVSGLVVRRTRIRCGEGRRHLRGHRHLRRHKRGHRAGISSRGREDGREVENEQEDVGDDHGGRRGEPGEDAPGHDGTAPGRSEGPGQGAEHSARCNAGDLVPGTPVKVAELVLIDGSAYYKLVGLIVQAPADEGEPQPEGEEEGEDAPVAG